MSKRGKGRGKGTGKDDNGEDKDAMAFKVLSSEHTTELMSLPVLQIQSRLKEIFNLENNEIDLKEAAILDYYTSAVYWGIQQKFTAQQLSGFFSVIHVLLDNVKEKHMTMVDNVNELKKLFVGIGLDDVKAAGLDFFNVQQTKLITEYIYSSFFQHYNLYSFMFSHSQAEEIIGTDLTIEVAKSADVPFPPPLDEGVTEEMHSLYIATPPPTPSPEPGGSKSESARTPRSADTTPKPGIESEAPKSRESTRKTAKSRLTTPKSGVATPKSRVATPKSRVATPETRVSTPNSKGATLKPKTASAIKLPEEEKPDPTKELEETVTQSDLFSQLTPEDVREVVESVTKEMLGNLQSEVATKLRDKESLIIQRINKIHKPEEEKPDPTKELEETVTQSDLFSQLTPEDVREVVESVTKEMLGNLQSEVATKLRDKESLIIQRINKIHKVAE